MDVIICPICGSVICPRCGSKMILRNGRYGKFYGCSSYPECTYTLDQEVVDRKRAEKEAEEEKEMEKEKEIEENRREYQAYQERERERRERECNSEQEDYDEDGVYVGPDRDELEVERDEGEATYKLTDDCRNKLIKSGCGHVIYGECDEGFPFWDEDINNIDDEDLNSSSYGGYGEWIKHIEEKFKKR